MKFFLKITLITTAYILKKIVWLVRKQAIPAVIKRADVTIGFILKDDALALASTGELSEFFVMREFPVALKKNASASAITQRERILTGSLSTTSIVKITTG